jgi:hypothetical protein
MSGRPDPFLHHPNGEHRGSAPTANGRDLERFEREMPAHVADGHRHPVYGGWSPALTRSLDSTGTCHYRVAEPRGDQFVSGAACGYSGYLSGASWPTRQACLRDTGAHPCRVCVRIERRTSG